MLSFHHVETLIRYFDEIDRAVTRKFLRPIPPDETAMTNELLALLDRESQKRERLLSFDLDHLLAELASFEDGVEFDATIETHGHSANLEHFVSQSDMGLVIEFNNYVTGEKQEWVYLLQAKQLKKGRGGGSYDDNSRFSSVDLEQHLKLNHLADAWGGQHFMYLLYSPAASDLSRSTMMKIRSFHSRNISRKIYDYVFGSALLDRQRQIRGKIDNGLWLMPISIAPNRIVELHARAFEETLPLSWFFVGHLASGHAVPLTKNVRGRITDTRSEIDHEDASRIVRGVARGDRQACMAFVELSRMASVAESREIPVWKILPASTMRIEVSVGKSLPEGERRVDIQP